MEKTVLSCPIIPPPKFHKRYKTIVKVDVHKGIEYVSMMEWIDQNSKGSVDVKSISDGYGTLVLYYGFENSDDALVFKIKYSK